MTEEIKEIDKFATEKLLGGTTNTEISLSGIYKQATGITDTSISDINQTAIAEMTLTADAAGVYLINFTISTFLTSNATNTSGLYGTIKLYKNAVVLGTYTTGYTNGTSDIKTIYSPGVIEKIENLAVGDVISAKWNTSNNAFTMHNRAASGSEYRNLLILKIS